MDKFGRDKIAEVRALANKLEDLLDTSREGAHRIEHARKVVNEAELGEVLWPAADEGYVSIWTEIEWCLTEDLAELLVWFTEEPDEQVRASV